MQVALAQHSGEGAYYGNKFTVSEKKDNGRTIYEGLTAKDSLQTQLSGEIKEVCQAKGCWMKVEIAPQEEVFVRFKDYGFFVPKDAADKKVFMQGMAFLEEMSVDDQKHYAKDSGASEEEINQIKEPKRILRFEAEGVLIKD
ncbi:MAG: DUF4920 domain-containing protein [Flavobacteriaceae bacterium]|jgi:hypothetical protein|uniref:DUF4920 domain-containing protein n=1 Tax=Flagellimonas TaxID=444459 RepID=UPI003BAC5339|nr:DUF4920 domain-containing protein [Flavobacteriaceae bacterium]